MGAASSCPCPAEGLGREYPDARMSRGSYPGHPLTGPHPRPKKATVPERVPLIGPVCRTLVHVWGIGKYLRPGFGQSASWREVNFPTVEFEDLIFFVQVEVKDHRETVFVLEPTL